VDLELKGSTVAGWAVAALIGFASGAVVFYTPQPSQSTRDRAAQPPMIPATPGGVSAVPIAPTDGTARWQPSPATGASQSQPILQDRASLQGTQLTAPPYGAAAGDAGTAALAPTNQHYAPAPVRSTVESANDRAAVSMASGSSTPAQHRSPEPILNVGGYSIQGDSVLAAPPTVDPRRQYRMSIDISKIP